MRTGKVSSVKDVENEGNVTKGIKFIKMDDGNGKEVGGFFKDIDRDPFLHNGRFLRGTIRLNDKKTGQVITSTDRYRELAKKTDHGRDEAKGHMMDREVAVAALSKALGMDHLPEASLRRLDIDGKKRMGVMVRSIHDQFGEPDAMITKAGDDMYTAYDLVSKHDKKFGDKLMFDLLIGNTDRHANNWMLKEKDGKGEFLAFDQGLSFPNSNNKYVNGDDFRNQSLFFRKAEDKELTSGFMQRFNKFLADGGFESMSEFIKDNIGDKEAAAFTERTAFFADAIFNKKKTSLNDMAFLYHNWKS